MSESHPSKVLMFDGDDPEMEHAKRSARKSFGYFWREVAWERRRIVPALDMATVKVPFADGPPSAHDEAWGLEFGDPAKVRLVPASQANGGLLKGLFRKRPDESAAPEGDHPMSVNMGPSLKERIAADPSFMTSPDDRGWTLLHHLALAGSTTGIRVLLEAGADPNVKTAKGFTAAQLARTLGWVEVIKLLEGNQANTKRRSYPKHRHQCGGSVAGFALPTPRSGALGSRSWQRRRRPRRNWTNSTS